jgi:pSer/pThr/pTyr-binding forkhead associated (FHA) protein
VPVRLVFDLAKPLVIGRFYPGSAVPDIDLAPFNADELGVSREHLLIKWEGESVVIVDNNSSNGTALNGKAVMPRLPYSVYHGDRLALGALEMQIEMLIDPLE